MGIGENVGENTGQNTGRSGNSLFLEPPSGFSLNTPTQTTLQASWTAPSKGGATGYLIKFDDGTTANTSVYGTGLIPWGVTNVTITNLSPGTNY